MSAPAQVKLADELAPDAKAPGRKTLAGLGILLLVLFVAGVIWNGAGGSEKLTEAPASSKATSGASTAAALASAPANSKETTTTKSPPSDEVLAALLGSGAVLFLVGALYPRITAIKLPGGGEVDLSAEERTQVAQQVAQVAAEKNAPQAETAQGAAKALALAGAMKAATGTLTAEGIELAARHGFE